MPHREARREVLTPPREARREVLTHPGRLKERYIYTQGG